MKAMWAARSPQERTIVAAGGAIVALVLVAALVWLPLERSRTRLSVEVPRLAESIAKMERQAAEVSRVRSMPAVGGPAATPSQPIATALGTRLPGAQLAPIDAKRMRLTGTDVAYGSLLEAIATAQSGYGMHVDSARIDALPVTGRVRAEIVLARP